jgi:ATPase subunit of ABC transporter with duplicated ATPase domains
MMGGKQVNSERICRDLILGGEQNKKVSMLSGGERKPFAPRMTLKKKETYCLMSLQMIWISTHALEEGLESFAGCAVVICMTDGFRQNLHTHS